MGVKAMRKRLKRAHADCRRLLEEIGDMERDYELLFNSPSRRMWRGVMGQVGTWLDCALYSIGLMRDAVDEATDREVAR